MIWIDVLIAASIILIAWSCLTNSDIHRSVVLFVALGTFVSFAWVRLDAVDVALAEVALGAGLTGALLFGAVGGRQYQALNGSPRSKTAEWLAVAASIVLGIASFLAFAASVPAGAELRLAVLRELDSSGASNPVTAVLLNFRSWDTLLEICVLFVALAGTRVLVADRRANKRPDDGSTLSALVRVVVPVSCLVAGYLLWQGTKSSGGAFQAGSVLAGAAVIATLAGHGAPRRWKDIYTRGAVVLGPFIFTIIGLGGWIARGTFLTLAPQSATILIVIIEAAATLTIAAALLGLFLAVTRVVPDTNRYRDG